MTTGNLSLGEEIQNGNLEKIRDHWKKEATSWKKKYFIFVEGKVDQRLIWKLRIEHASPIRCDGKEMVRLAVEDAKKVLQEPGWQFQEIRVVGLVDRDADEVIPEGCIPTDLWDIEATLSLSGATFQDFSAEVHEKWTDAFHNIVNGESLANSIEQAALQLGAFRLLAHRGQLSCAGSHVKPSFSDSEEIRSFCFESGGIVNFKLRSFVKRKLKNLAHKNGRGRFSREDLSEVVTQITGLTNKFQASSTMKSNIHGKDLLNLIFTFAQKHLGTKESSDEETKKDQERFVFDLIDRVSETSRIEDIEFVKQIKAYFK